ncbi:BA14K family protein [Ensifer adhaerens]|uniref:BA14K family protein n=1 Tax=Ensifer adhaerens TaxID=106592 RepID=UPI001CF0A124|nr:BA14K family protein [Ensifer adhaerens]
MASLVLAKPTEPSSLKVASAPDLWAATPVRIDRSQQNYERLPPVYSTYVTKPVSAELTSGRLAPTAPASVASHTGLSTAHLDWCSSRYRSYNPETNPYRSSGQIRTCQSL